MRAILIALLFLSGPAFAQDRDPGQARLRALEEQKLE